MTAKKKRTDERRITQQMSEEMKEKMNAESAEAEENAAAEAAADTEEAAEADNSEEAAGEDEILKKNKKIEELTEQLSAEKDKYLRVAAEYDNFRRRSLKDKEDAADKAKSAVIIEFLGVIDNFERALASESADESFRKGVEMIYNQYVEILKKQGVEEIEAMDKPFDPNIHSAVTQVTDENLGENVVCQVFQKGYIMNGKVIRHAMVAVANP